MPGAQGDSIAGTLLWKGIRDPVEDTLDAAVREVAKGTGINDLDFATSILNGAIETKSARRIATASDIHQENRSIPTGDYLLRPTSLGSDF
jgi:hypothetical protein